MPRNGLGVFSKVPGSTVTPNTTIESAVFNAVIDDLVDDLNTDRPITAGGTGASSAADARTNLGLVKATSTSDTTAGRLALTGSFGIGGTGIAIPNANLDDIAHSGVYTISGGSTTNSPFAENGVAFHFDRGGRAFQIAGEASAGEDNRLYQRQLSGDGWSDWAPIAALVEEVTNANGTYRRWSDGMQECTAVVTITSTIALGFAGGFRCAPQTWTFPAAFSAAPVVMATVDGLTAFGAAIDARTTSTATWVVTAVTSQTSASRTVQFYARGRRP